ncbi:hypothetical protein [Streptomyces sp. NPDC090036]
MTGRTKWLRYEESTPASAAKALAALLAGQRVWDRFPAAPTS